METKKAKVLITGANRGIGKALAKRLAEDGAHLILANRSHDHNLAAELKKAGASDIELIETDLSSSAGVQKLIDQTHKMNIDILFNNAGILTGGLLEEQKWEDIEKMLQVNVSALIQLTKGLLPGMLKRKRGKIINHSSVSGVMHLPSASTYAASKAAVLAFTNSLKLELKGTGVTTLVLVTPAVKTRMFDLIDPLYGKHFESPTDGLKPERYAEMIREAILEDLSELTPSGLTGLVLGLSKFIPPLFERGVAFKFKR